MYCMFKDGYMHLHGYTCHVHFRYAISEDKRNVVVSQEAIRSIQILLMDLSWFFACMFSVVEARTVMARAAVTTTDNNSL